MIGRTTAVVLFGTALAVAAVIVWTFPVREWVIGLSYAARDGGARSKIVFFLAYVICTIALVPGSLLTLAAGFAFGPVWGLAVASPGSVAGATGAFLLARTVLRGWAERKTERSRHAQAIQYAVQEESFKVVLLLRLSPVIPFNVLNYVLGVTRVRLRTYVIASAVGMLPGTVWNLYLGSLGMLVVEAASGGELGTAHTALIVGGLAATGAVVLLVSRAARRALQRQIPAGGA